MPWHSDWKETTKKICNSDKGIFLFISRKKQNRIQKDFGKWKMVRKIWDKNKFRKKTDEEVFKKVFFTFWLVKKIIAFFCQL